MTTTASIAQATEGEFKGADGTRLFYRSWRTPGVEAKRLVITVHGFADHSGRMPDLVQHLCARGAVVYGFDQRGAGLSAGQRGHVMHYSELVDDLDRFIKLATEKEPGLERVLLGHSTGGILALTWAYDHPDRIDRLILSAPALILAFAASPVKVAIGNMLSGLAPRLSLNAGFDTGSVSRDPEWVEKTKQDPEVTQAITTRFYKEVYQTAAPAALARIEDLKVPFLYIHGGDDRLIAPRVADEFRARAKAPGSIHVYEGAYHETFNDLDKEKVFADIDAWLEGA